ncbi:MAG: glycosyltransferase family 4 protein [Candidatus Thermoplasmatota archaeon]|nr:glycosyltransferase family 4 protein [Candidatus Thermoplasmatota archaeon]
MVVPKLLYIAHDFPPMGGANSIRNYRIVKYLCKFGWEVHVLTEAIPEWKKRSSLYDLNLLKEVPDVKIHRSWAGMERTLDGIPRKLHINPRWIRAPDGCVYWSRAAYRTALKLIRREHIDVMITTSSPTSSHLLGLRLKKKTGIPWVADFQDPWVRNFGIPFPTNWHRNREAKMEAAVVSSADLVLNVTKSLDEEMKKEYPDLSKDKFMVVYNGFDPECFEGLKYRRTECFTIRYVGSLWNLDPVPVLQALVSLKERKKVDSRFHLEFIGPAPENLKKLAPEMGLSDYVEFKAPVNHLDVPGILVSSDCLLLMLYRGKGRERILGGKIGETLASRRPLMIVANEGEFASLMHEAGASHIAEPEDVEGIAAGISDLFEQWKAGKIRFEPNEELISLFDHKNTIIPELSKRMANLAGGKHD